MPLLVVANKKKMTTTPLETVEAKWQGISCKPKSRDKEVGVERSLLSAFNLGTGPRHQRVCINSSAKDSILLTKVHRKPEAQMVMFIQCPAWVISAQENLRKRREDDLRKV